LLGTFSNWVSTVCPSGWNRTARGANTVPG
jgi:hypothetical protein